MTDETTEEYASRQLVLATTLLRAFMAGRDPDGPPPAPHAIVLAVRCLADCTTEPDRYIALFKESLDSCPPLDDEQVRALLGIGEHADAGAGAVH